MTLDPAAVPTDFQRAKADHDFLAQQLELHGNTESMRVIEQHLREIRQRLPGQDDVVTTSPPRLDLCGRGAGS